MALNSHAIDPIKLLTSLAVGVESDAREQHLKKALQAFVTVSDTYRHFPKATVSIKATSESILSQKWVGRNYELIENSVSLHTAQKLDHGIDNSLKSGDEKKFDLSESESEEGTELDKADLEKMVEVMSPIRLSRGATFALLATYESGTYNPEPSRLSEVIAMSSGDSIFVAAQLLMDPAESDIKSTNIQWIRGNIGKPGIAMLVPPAEPLVKEREAAKWNVVNHHPFNGVFDNNFQGTSMHLSFTEYSQPLNAGIHGMRDAEIYFLEAIVSVYDSGTWIGDVSIINSMESKCFKLFKQLSSSCYHPSLQVRGMRMVSIDNWDEFIDYPSSIMVVRAKGNWLARLAAASLSVQRKHVTVVLSHESEICWPCIRNKYKLGPNTKDFALIA
jgi:hypothetical protein